MQQDDTSSLIYAATSEGYLLPVIDVTSRRFAVADDPESLRELFDAAALEEQRYRRVPKFIMRLMMTAAAKRSLLVRAISSPAATYLDGLSTYVMKLGAENLPPPYTDPADLRIAASAPLTLLRLRTQQVARLMADELVTHLDGNAAPLHFINIGGGPAIDSMNALLLLNQRERGLLRRPLVIHVLDLNEPGPFFGRNALAALMAEGRPLAGLDVSFEHRPYDWAQPDALKALAGTLAGTGAVVAASSEGGLFEYGSDEAVVANLQALRGARLVAGSVTSADASRRRSVTASRFKLIPRGLEGFAPLAARGGFSIAKAETAQLSDQVLLRPL
jgi:hypothetical protein